MLLKGDEGGAGGYYPLGHLKAGGWGGVIIPLVNLTVTGNGGRSQLAAGRKMQHSPGTSLLLVTLPPPNFAPP
jgi:hypothetical protein